MGVADNSNFKSGCGTLTNNCIDTNTNDTSAHWPLPWIAGKGHHAKVKLLHTEKGVDDAMTNHFAQKQIKIRIQLSMLVNILCKRLNNLADLDFSCTTLSTIHISSSLLPPGLQHGTNSEVWGYGDI